MHGLTARRPLGAAGWAGPALRLLVTGRRPDVGMRPLLDRAMLIPEMGILLAMGKGLIRRGWSWLWSPTSSRTVRASRPPKPNAECPVCRRPIVVRGTTYLGNMYFGPMMAPWTRQELINACTVHSRAPFNDETVQALGAEPPP